MEVTPEAVRDGKFREALRGYNRDDVDEFLERVAAGIAVLQERVREATERATRAEAQATEATELDDSLRRTLVLAQRTADLAVSEARREADELLEQARSQHEAMTREIESERDRLREETQKAVHDEVVAMHETREHLRGDIDALHQYYERQREWLRSALVAQLKALDEETLDVGDPPGVTEVDPLIVDSTVGRLEPSEPADASDPAGPSEPSELSVPVDEELDATGSMVGDLEAADLEGAEQSVAGENNGISENTAAMFLSELQRVMDAQDGDPSDDDGLPPPDERARAFFDEDDEEGARRFGGIRRRRRRT